MFLYLPHDLKVFDNFFVNFNLTCLLNEMRRAMDPAELSGMTVTCLPAEMLYYRKKAKISHANKIYVQINKDYLGHVCLGV